MKTIDVRGLSCPEPLMIVGEVLDEDPKAEFKILVDEGHTRTNVEYFLRQRGKQVEVLSTGHEFEILVK